MNRRARFAIALAAFVAPILPPAFAQDYPAKAIRLIVPFPPAGGTDVLSRAMAQAISVDTKWTIVIENKPGAGGNIGLDAAAHAPKDGYTIAMGQTANLAVNPALYTSMTFDPLKDFAPIALISSQPLILVVDAKSPYQSLKDLVDAAKKSPGKINMASPGNGTIGHIGGELFQRRAGITMTHVPYKGASPAVTDLMGGSVDCYFGNSQAVGGLVASRAVASARRDIAEAPRKLSEGSDGRRIGLSRDSKRRRGAGSSRPRARRRRSSTSSTPRPTRRSRARPCRSSSPTKAARRSAAPPKQFGDFMKRSTPSGALPSAKRTSSSTSSGTDPDDNYDKGLSRIMWNLSNTPPQVIEARVLTRLPDSFRSKRRNEWSDANKPGHEVDSFLEGPSFDRDGNLFVVDIPFGRIFRISPTLEWTLVAEYDGWPNGLAFHRDGSLWITDYRRGLLRHARPRQEHSRAGSSGIQRPSSATATANPSRA